jgi:hypothetical protein
MRPWLAACLLSLAGTATAQTVEIAPMVGYRFGGDFDIVSIEGDGRLEVKESAAFGASISVSIAEDGELEALFARQGTRLARDGFFESSPLFDLAVETYHLGGHYLLGGAESQLRPYFGVGLGVTRLVPEPDDLESETRFSASFAGGLKAYLSGHLGLRAEVRWFYTFLDGDNRVFCGSLSGCLVHGSGTQLSQGELRGGVVVRF